MIGSPAPVPESQNAVARSPVDTGMISWVTMRLPRKPHRTQSENKSENRTGIEIGIGIGVSRNAICPTDSRRPRSKLGRKSRNQEARVVNINIGIDRCLRVHRPDARTRIALRSTDPSPTRGHRHPQAHRTPEQRAYAMPVASRFFLKMFSWTVRGRKGERSCQHAHRQTARRTNARMHKCTSARMHGCEIEEAETQAAVDGGRTEWNVPFTKKEVRMQMQKNHRRCKDAEDVGDAPAAARPLAP